MMFLSFGYRWIFSSFLLVTLLSFAQAQADTTLTLEVNEDIEIDILQIGEPAKVAIIWFTCNQGDETIENETARKLAKNGYQFYFPDMLSTHFLSPTPSNIAKVPTEEISKVIQHIVKLSNSKEIYLLGGARSAVPVIKGLSDQKVIAADQKLKGALLISPRINSKSPEPGAEPVYIKEAGLSRHSILILEGERTPNRWGLPHLSHQLGQSGSTVHTDLIKGVRGFFYLRPEKTPAESKLTSQLDQLIDQNINKLRGFPQ